MTLNRQFYNINEAQNMLGMNRSQVNRWMRKLGLGSPGIRTPKMSVTRSFLTISQIEAIKKAVGDK